MITSYCQWVRSRIGTKKRFFGSVKRALIIQLYFHRYDKKDNKSYDKCLFAFDCCIMKKMHYFGNKLLKLTSRKSITKKRNFSVFFSWFLIFVFSMNSLDWLNVTIFFENSYNILHTSCLFFTFSQQWGEELFEFKWVFKIEFSEWFHYMPERIQIVQKLQLKKK